MPDVLLHDDSRWLGRLAAEWREAVASTDGERPLAGLGWYRTALAESVVDVAPQVLVVRDGETLLGIVPLVVECRRTWLGAARVLRFPSDGSSSRCGVLGPHPGTALAFALRHLARRNGWDLLQLDDPDCRPRTRTALRLSGLRFRRCSVEVTVPGRGPRLFADDDFETPLADRYVARRPRSARSWLLARDAELQRGLLDRPLVIDGQSRRGGNA